MFAVNHFTLNTSHSKIGLNHVYTCDLGLWKIIDTNANFARKKAYMAFEMFYRGKCYEKR